MSRNWLVKKGLNLLSLTDILYATLRQNSILQNVFKYHFLAEYNNSSLILVFRN